MCDSSTPQKVATTQPDGASMSNLHVDVVSTPPRKKQKLAATQSEQVEAPSPTPTQLVTQARAQPLVVSPGTVAQPVAQVSLAATFSLAPRSASATQEAALRTVLACEQARDVAAKYYVAASVMKAAAVVQDGARRIPR